MFENVEIFDGGRFDPLPSVAAMQEQHRRSRWRAPVAGALAVGCALAAGELVAAVAGAVQTPLLAVGAEFVDRFAASLKEIAVAVFGTHDKDALLIGTVVVTLALGAVAGALAHRARWLVPALVAALAVVGAASQLADPRAALLPALLGALVATAVGGWVWWALERVARGEPGGAAGDTPSRRQFLTASGLATFGAVVAGAVSRAVGSAVGPDPAPDIALPEPTSSVPVPDTAAFDAEGISRYVTPTPEFYRIDTALAVPRVDAASWRLRVTGMVDRPLDLGLDDLLAMPAVEMPVTLQCVSNTVGGDLVGNAVWQGVPLLDVLERAGVQPGAEQVLSTSVDGWTSGFPVDVLDGDRTALVAYAMNGDPLPAEHGYPVRLVVAGLYGYVSATKWLESIELTTWEGRDGYWVPRGWAKEGPIKLASRIDVPRRGQQVSADALVIGGVAWLPATGVGAVEVSVDDGPWQGCELAPVASSDTWVQWRLPVPGLVPGRHRARVRATDAEGNRQTEEVRPPAPDGATGLHEQEFEVVG